MKKSVAILFVFAVVLVFSVQVHAALELRGEGTSADGTYRLIYDTDFNITWYDYARSSATWQTQMNWASAHRPEPEWDRPLLWLELHRKRDGTPVLYGAWEQRVL